MADEAQGTHAPQPTSTGNDHQPSWSTTQDIAELVERLHARIDHADDRVSSAAVRVVTSVGPFLLLIFAVAQYLQPQAKDLSEVDSRLLFVGAGAAAMAFVLALISISPRRVANVDGYFVEKAADGTAKQELSELVAQEAHEAGSRQRALRRRGGYVFAAMCAYAVSVACSGAYLYVVVVSK